MNLKISINKFIKYFNKNINYTKIKNKILRIHFLKTNTILDLLKS